MKRHSERQRRAVMQIDSVNVSLLQFEKCQSNEGTFSEAPWR
jgi:hypothetical protein